MWVLIWAALLLSLTERTTCPKGEPVTLTCTAPGIGSGSPPNITWTWRGTGDNITELRDNTTIQRREDLTNVTTTHFSTLTFTPSAGHHNMMVTCQVTFQKTYTFKETVTLNVSYLRVILPGSGCVDQAEVMTCVCVSQGVPLPLIEWPLLELNTDNTTSVLGSSVNSTISLLVGNYNNITVECVSSNVVGVVREKLQVTQNKSQEKQEDKEWEDIIAMLSDLKLIAAFVIGAAFSSTICCIILCLTGKCKRQKKRIPKDSKTPFINLEMVACEDQQTDAGQAVGGEQKPLQLELRGGAENGGTQTSGAAGKFDTREEPNEVDYASINYSLLKKKTPEEAEKKTTTAESEYAKIKREKNEGDEDGGEESGMMMMMMGKDEEKENGKPAAETDEDTALYSNVKVIMGGGE
ncbi:sialic acid-binding Ig-like lectin 7 isoform X4 [Oncorhynchus kisutch]|uniref:sialic acid-binding Ig-like lectin 7 isoform X4 n=1 Tax=Oncorhynchus kisutch TaxID=8019 RepID=UPI0012DF2894|nr:sialic acid-binding Ig-like lectin 7 isoform X4 [Oncorhynchus kisutch]XP_031642501.1 sialic acid-binding Ig-like lectin 7 isoform X4 [Oncorhynchus kisutch]